MKFVDSIFFVAAPVEPVGEYSVSSRALVSGVYRTWRKVGRRVGGQWIVDPRQLTFVR